MWFIADIFERYTTGVAKTFLRVAALEADATRRISAERRAVRRQAHVDVPQERQQVAAPEVLAAPEPVAAPVAEPIPEPVAVAPSAPADAPVVAQAAAPTGDMPTGDMPMGVRADVVVKWVETLGKAERREAAELLEKLRKDKKVRVAELQMIVSGVLCEAPTYRKKDEHLALLRGHFGSGERTRSATSVPTVVHAN